MLSIKTARMKSFPLPIPPFQLPSRIRPACHLNIQITLVVQALKDRKNILHTFSGTSFFTRSSIKLQFIVGNFWRCANNEEFENQMFLFVMSNIFKRFTESYLWLGEHFSFFQN
jgi:hypothetical protein